MKAWYAFVELSDCPFSLCVRLEQSGFLPEREGNQIRDDAMVRKWLESALRAERYSTGVAVLLPEARAELFSGCLADFPHISVANVQAMPLAAGI